MQTAMTVEDCYVDSSALRQLYAHDRHSPQMAARRFKNPGALGVTRFTRAELVNSMAAAVHRRDIAPEEWQDFQNDLAADFSSDRLRLVDVPWRAVLDRATELSRLHTPNVGTRTLDVLHVASALELKARHFVTYDVRQSRLAASCGLKVIQP